MSDVTFKIIRTKKVKKPENLKTSGEFTKWYCEQQKQFEKETLK